MMHLYKSICVVAVALASIVTSSPVLPAPTDSVVCNESAANDTTCQIVRAEAPAHSLQERAVGAQIYYDTLGNVIMVIPWVVNYQLAQLFEGSGYSLAKNLQYNCRSWCLAQDGDRATFLTSVADWSAMMDFKSRYLADLLSTTANYATISVVVKTQAAYAYETATMMSNWFSQGPSGATIINLGASSALTYVRTKMAGGGPSPTKRDEVPDEIDSGLVARATDWCSQPISGEYNAGAIHTPRNMYYNVGC